MRSDAELMQRLRGGDASVLDSLITCHGAALRRHLERYVPAPDAEDLLQETWLRVWQRAGQWDGRGRLLAWLLAIATNLALNHLRARRPLMPLDQPSDPERGEWGDPPEVATRGGDAVVPGPEEQVLWRAQLGRLQEAMAQLPPEKRLALHLVRVQGLKLEEAARRLQIPLGTLKSRLHHAHRLLMEHLEEEDERD